MRRALPIDCGGAQLAGVAHPAAGRVGVVIVTGGVQTRVGAHRGFVDLADCLSAAGVPVLRFDRRGIGDSDGDDPGFRDSAADIAAAVAAFRNAFPAVQHVAGWGLCDGAAALALHAADTGFDSLMLANPWTLDSDGAQEIPPRAAVAARYRNRLRDPREWLRLLRGGVDLRQLAKGLLRLARSEPPSNLVVAMAAALRRFDGPLLLIFGERDNTGNAFHAAWNGPVFKAVRQQKNVMIEKIAGAGHSFARVDEAAALADACVRWLQAVAGRQARSPDDQVRASG